MAARERTKTTPPPTVTDSWAADTNRQRSKRVVVTATPDEERAIRQAAKGHPGGVGGWLRDSGLEKAGKPTPTQVVWDAAQKMLVDQANAKLDMLTTILARRETEIRLLRKLEDAVRKLRDATGAMEDTYHASVEALLETLAALPRDAIENKSRAP
jgi:hypothetical protein